MIGIIIAIASIILMLGCYIGDKIERKWFA